MQRVLPQVPHTSKIGYSAAELLSSVLGMFSNVIPIPTEKDLGIDMRAELLSGPTPIGMHYNIQCKGTEDVIIDENSMIIQIKVTTINYWLQQKEPTFLIVVDRTKQKFFWSYPLHQVEDRIEEIQAQEKVTIHVSKTSYFDYNIKKLPSDMLAIIHQYDHYILGNIPSSISRRPLNSKFVSSDSIYEKGNSKNNSRTKAVSTVQILEEIDHGVSDNKKEIISEIFMIENHFCKTELFKLPPEIDFLGLSKTRVLINELLDDFYDINSALSNAGFTNLRGFELSADEKEVPFKLVLSFGMGVPIRVLQRIISILSNYHLEYLDFVDYRQEVYDEYISTVAIGTYSYHDTNLGLIKINDELLEKLLDPLLSANKFYGLVIQDVHAPCIDW